MSEQQEPEVVVFGRGQEPEQSAERPEEEEEGRAEVQQPAKVMRIAAMVRSLLDEVRAAPLDEASRARLREIYQTSVEELSEVLSGDLHDELRRLSFPFEGTPSDAELRAAHAQLVGWLEGLFHGIQAMMFAQQMEQRARMAGGGRPGLPSGAERPVDPSTGQYL